ncbi:hypothetical protein CAEBREN_10408 [Caenorhabditis brenneri]|uniref:Sdz-33 F-box domain-containing protein n=1 Tax=Caenorhabditis brenneri TaxID=135651 RepID=G0NDL1_CAEBE|nr:hypothetical protein CAEBREN_10408 [Caenorhabditis brenneri]
MTNAHSFPLLRLPLLAAIKGIQLMNVREQFKLSKLSKRLLFIVKTSVKKQSFKLDIKLRKEFPVKIKSRTARNKYVFNFQPGLDYPDLESIQNFIVHVASVFSDLTISLDFNDARYPRYLMDLVPLTKNLNLTRGFLRAFTDRPDDELCRFIFKECNDFKRIYMYCRTTPDFELSPEQTGAFCTDQFVINDPWFSMNHVLQSFMDCKKLDLLSLDFSVTDVNKFLRNWIQGSGVNYLICNVSGGGEVRMESLLKGITAVPEPEVMISSDGLGRLRHYGCFIIEQSNGVKGVVSRCWNKLFVLSTVFELENGEKYGNWREEEFYEVETDDESADGEDYYG